MINKTRTILFFLVISFWLYATGPLVAQTTPPPYQTPTPYKLLAPIPLDGSDSGVTRETTTAKYIPGLIKLVIALAGVLAVLRLIFAGIMYMSTDAFSGKSEAKGIIENALWGLFLAMSAWLILYTLNPKLVTLNLNITPQEISPGTVPGEIPASGPAGELQQSTTNAVAGLREACSNCTIRITSTTGDSHDPNSLHFQGLAVDIGADANLTKFLTGQTTNPQACATYLKTLNGVSSRFKWEPAGEKCGGAVASTGDHWHMSVNQ